MRVEEPLRVWVHSSVVQDRAFRPSASHWMTTACCPQYFAKALTTSMMQPADSVPASCGRKCVIKCARGEEQLTPVVSAAVASTGCAGDVGDRRPRVRYDCKQLRRSAELDAGVEVPAQRTTGSSV